MKYLIANWACIVLGIFLDTETNGLNPQKHKLLEIAYKIVDVGQGILLETFESLVFQKEEIWNGSDKESLKINGFTWEEISKGKSPSLISEEILTQFKKWEIKRGSAVFICQNPSFDRAFFSQLIDVEKQESLLWPYHWLDLASMYWAVAIEQGKINPLRYPWETGLSKDLISTTYHLPPEAKPHRAMNGVNHLLLCYQAVVGFPLT